MTMENQPSTTAQTSQHATTPSTSTVSAAASMTVIVTETESRQNAPEVLTLTLQARPTVTWDENVVDNEGMGRKSSKRCCIFHKQRDFGESSTDSSDYDSEDNDSEKKRQGKIARPKNREGKVHDYQRYHA